MLNLTINDRLYLIEFRHVTKFGKRRQLFDRAPVNAVTTCVIACFSPVIVPNAAAFQPVAKVEFIAIDNSICALGDNFSRREGRKVALRKALKHCGALKDIKGELWATYLEHDPLLDARPRWDKNEDEYYVIREDLAGDVKSFVGGLDARAQLKRTAMDPLSAKQLKDQGQAGKHERRQARKQSKRASRQTAATP